MTRIPSKNLESGIRDFLFIRSHKPFQYSGTWHLGWIDGTTYCYEREHALKARLRKAGLPRIEYVTISPA